MVRWKNWLRRPLQLLLGDAAAGLGEAVAADANKNSLLRSVGDEIVGAAAYFIYPGLGGGGPFNGQRSRRELFQSLIAKFAPIAIIETGTHLGTTTEFLATTGLPVFSVEGNRRNYGFAWARLWRHRNVHLLCGDSRAALRRWFNGPLGRIHDGGLFVYLDAHWGFDLPLAEELDIIFGIHPNSLIMVDDFQVPFDAGYGYDDYGGDQVLTEEYIKPVVAEHRLRILYPTTPSVEETGARRGCVVLAKNNIRSLGHTFLPLLREK
jgi:hypothetical protein